MAAKEFAEYKYGTTTNYSKGILNFIAVSMAIGIIFTAININPYALALILIPIIIIILNKRSASVNLILIGGRYLIIGTNVVYYKNIEKTELDKKIGKFTLTTTEGNTYNINSASFPTNARKPDKIKINKTAKFEKAVDKIIARLKEIAPGSIK